MNSIENAIKELNESYYKYIIKLKTVLDYGDDNIEFLIKALDNKFANPIAKALGLMMYSQKTDTAIPKLLEWVVTQTPIYPEVFEALVRAGDRPAKQTFELLHNYSAIGDDEAVRHLLDLARHFSPAILHESVKIFVDMMSSNHPEIREAAIDFTAKLGLPFGAEARQKLTYISQNDVSKEVRASAIKALDKISD
jgi:HEAT repeat protein